MLFTQQNVELTSLSEFMEKQSMSEQQIKLSEEEVMLNNILTDFTSHDTSSKNMNFGGGL
jgi:hypothetical protein